MHPGAIAVSGPQAPEAAAVLEQQARARRCSLRWVEPLPCAANGGPVLGLRGALQRHNGAVAQGAALALAERGWPISAAAIRQGLAEARWPGRLERRSFQGRPLLVDGAHNPPAALALRQELDGEAGAAAAPRRWLIGIQRHKEAPQLLEALLRPGDQVRVVPLPEHTSWSAAELRQQLPAAAIQQGEGDLTAQLAWLGGSEALPVVAGSLYLVAAVLPLLDATD